MAIDLYKLLKEMTEKGASDLHLGAGAVPHLRIDERLVEVGKEKLNIDSAKELIYSALTNEQEAKFEIGRAHV